MEDNKVWLVTGASKGLGFALVRKLLAQGFRVTATTRNITSLQEDFGKASDKFLPLKVDLTDNGSAKHAVEKSITHFGRLDVIVNNAGYGQTGTLEEVTDEEARENFEVNVFGAINIIRNAMPYLREQKSGTIFNISSVGGYFGAFPGWGIYCATKFAIAGLTESLAEEVREFGVNATVVYPGTFRTNFLTKGSIRTPQQPIEEYRGARQVERKFLDEINGNQANDPDKAADVLIAISKEQNPPVHLILGSDALDLLKLKTELITGDAQRWESLTLSTAVSPLNS